MKNLHIAQPLHTFRPLSEEVYDVLRSAIVGGDLLPGSRIVEADIARQMAISRSPVREAVRKLEQEGLVEYVPRRGTIVVGLSRDDVADAYQLRAHLEAYGARLPASRRGVPRADVLSALESGDGQPLSAVVDDWLVGTPEAITDQLRTYERLGITHVMLWFLDYPSLDGMRLFSEHVLRTMQTDSPPLAAHAVTRR